MAYSYFKKILPTLIILFSASPVFAQDHSITDDTGRNVSVPENPQRIVILHEPLLGIPALDLGAHIVGIYGRDDQGNSLTKIDFIDAVLKDHETRPPGIGPFGEIDLEKLQALKPDLIIGTEYNSNDVPQLSKVAPVYLQHVSTGKSYGISVEKDLAGVLGRQQNYAQRLALYQERLDHVKKEFPLSPVHPTYLAIIIHDQLNLIGNMSGVIQSIEDLGYQKAELDSGTGITKGMGATFSVPLSPETFGRLNPDLLIVMNSYVNGDRGEQAIRQRLDKIIPGWQRFLKPEREGRVLYLDSGQVATPSIASALNTLDAYEKWQKKRKQTQ